MNDRTEQHSTSVRNRRASAVREVSQSEHEQVSTRVVANYNHMHALTVQYYEVVQIYRVLVRVHSIQRVLFLPFELLDFSEDGAADVVARFRVQLLAAALTERVAALLLDDRGEVEIRAAIRVQLPSLFSDVALGGLVATAHMARTSTGTEGSGTAPTTGQPAPTAGTVLTAPAPAVVRRITSPGPLIDTVPGDVELVAASFDGIRVDRVRFDQVGVPADNSTFAVPNTTFQVDLPGGLPLRNVTAIHVTKTDADADSGTMTLHYRSATQQLALPVPLDLAAGTSMQKVAFLAADPSNRRDELMAHLQTNRAYYSQAVLGNLDSATLVMLLSRFTWKGKALADQVEPNPLAVAGNYLVLRAPIEDDEAAGLDDNGTTWGELLRQRALTSEQRDDRLVPIPTGGVFAEAVLGRSNSAEKLDITRFWNWQDSPIPLQPPEIAPVSTGSRATAEDLRPGQLGAPVLNILNPTALPEPAGLTAALNTLASASMFRDMSGLAGTQATAQAASAGTLTAATEAGRIASENFKAATTQATEMGKAAADMWKVMEGGESGGSGKSTGGISGQGARINQGRDLDRRGVPGSAAPGGVGEPKVTETKPVFAAASETTQPTMETFSRELAYSDESAAVSPQMIGATTAALGSAAAGAGGLAGFAGSIGSGVVDVLQVMGEQLVLGVIRSDATRVGIALQGVDLIPMRLHDNHVEFEQVEFAAWTNSSKRVYVNIPWFVKQYSDAVAGSTAPDDALRQARALAVCVMRHEEHHVTQFVGNGDKPPASFGDMIDFENQAYGQDVSWVQSQLVQSFMLNDIGTSQTVVTAIENSATDAENTFENWKTNLQNEPARKSAMSNAGFLPKIIRGTANYKVDDLYITRAP